MYQTSFKDVQNQIQFKREIFTKLRSSKTTLHSLKMLIPSQHKFITVHTQTGDIEGIERNLSRDTTCCLNGSLEFIN